MNSSFWKHLVLLQIICLIKYSVSETIEEPAPGLAKREDIDEQNSLSSAERVSDSSSENRFSSVYEVSHSNDPNYLLQRLNHRFEELSLTVRQIIHSCPCAKGVPSPWGNHGNSNLWGAYGQTETNSWGNVGSPGGNHLGTKPWKGFGQTTTNSWGSNPWEQYGQSGSGSWGGQGQSGSGIWGGQGQSGSGTWGGQGQSGSGSWGGHGQSGSGSLGGYGQSGSGTWGGHGQSGSGSWGGHGQSGSGTWGGYGQSGSGTWGGHGQSGSGSWGGHGSTGSNLWNNHGSLGSSHWGGGGWGIPQNFRPKSCGDHYRKGNRRSGIQTIYPFQFDYNKQLSVACDQSTSGGGWTVIMHRTPNPRRVNFARTWDQYVNGFGYLSGEFWLGLENIHAVINSTLCTELRIEMEDFNRQKAVAKYKFFKIGDKYSNYRMTLNGYSGNAGDSLYYSNGQAFSTFDRDHDKHPSNCAAKFSGGWWYNSCHMAKLTGKAHHGKHQSYADGINWKTFRGYNYSVKTATMKIRSTSCPDYHSTAIDRKDVTPAV